MGGSSSANARSGPPAVTFDRLPPPWAPATAVPRLPIGVAIVSALIAVAGVVMVLGGILYFLAQLGGPFLPSALDLFPSTDMLGAGILAVLGIALLVIATSLWRQETWALWTTLAVVFGTTVYLFFTGSVTVLFVLLILLFVYLLAVRRYFY
jgi:hypothetical protein